VDSNPQGMPENPHIGQLVTETEEQLIMAIEAG